ncbi:MAG: SAM-dependent DNA methyltransferase [Bacteroidaceae bacterium]|nr:SAM-dependent DNA methyltransferase [Bacteroidaceae bacterium]
MEEHKNTKYLGADEQISLDELKSFLWGAATRLRGQIDAAGYKEYIFPLLFFKRISDVYDEQFQDFVCEGGEEYASMQAEELPIRIPEGAHWNDVREVTENVGQRLVEAFIAIEQANPGEEADGRIIGGLDGIFGPKDGWTNKAKMPDHIITSLIEDFSRYNLSLAHCPADEMGQAYEYLVGKFADDAGNTAQEFYTNRTVVTLMAEILQPQPDESIYDPTCGSGGMLVKCLDFLRQKGEPWQGVKVFGQEINALTSSIARMNLYLNGVEDFSIVREDTLAHPAFVNGSKLRKFDIVLANPPYSIKTWNREAFQNDKWGRNFLGTPPQGRADYAFFQHILASMDEKTGRCAILFPHGVLFRKEESDIRHNLLKKDLVECVIGIGRNLFYNSCMDACVVICRKNKPNNRKDKILFIDAKNEVTRKNAESYLEPHHIEKIASAYQSFTSQEGFCCVVENKDVLKNNAKMSVAKYVKNNSFANEESVDPEEAIEEWNSQSDILNCELDRLLNCFVN